MKLLGQTSTGFLVEITDGEIANILGHTYKSQLKESLCVNREISVSKIYAATRDVRSAKTRVQESAQALQKIVDSLLQVNIEEFTEL